MRNFTKKEEQILLAIFHLKEEAYLISIREEIKKYTGKTYAVGTIYAPLNRLHVYGYLEISLGKTSPEVSKKPIQYYRLTPKGMAALEGLKKQTDLMWEGFSFDLLGEHKK